MAAQNSVSGCFMCYLVLDCFNFSSAACSKNVEIGTPVFFFDFLTFSTTSADIFTLSYVISLAIGVIYATNVELIFIPTNFF